MKKFISFALNVVVLITVCMVTPVALANNDENIWYCSTISSKYAVRTDNTLWDYSSGKEPIKIMNDVISIGEKFYIKSDNSLWVFAWHIEDAIKIDDNVVSAFCEDDVGYIKNDGSLWVVDAGWNDSIPRKIADDVIAGAFGLHDHIAYIKNDRSLWTQGFYYFEKYPDTYMRFDEPKFISNDVQYVYTEKVLELQSSYSTSQRDLFVKNDGSLWEMRGREGGDYWIGKIMDNVKKVFDVRKDGAILNTDNSLWVKGWGHDDEEKKILNNVVDCVFNNDWPPVVAHALTNKGELYIWGDPRDTDDFIRKFPCLQDMDEKEISGKAIKIMDNVKLPNNDSNTITKPTLGGFPQTLSITLGNLPDTLYVNGVNDVAFSVDNEDVIELQPTSLTQLGAKQAMSAVWVTGKTPGTATITATAPDGRTAQCVVTVNGQIAETISDEMILKAKICANNSEYRYIADRFTPPNVILLQNIDDGTLTAANANHAIKELSEGLSLNLSLDDFYEIALISMLDTNDSWVDGVYNVLSDDTLNFAVKQINEIIKSSPTKEALDKELLKKFDYSEWTQIDVISKGIEAGKSMDAYISDMYALKYTSNEFKLMLELIKENTEINELKNACVKLLGDIEKAEEKSEAKIVAGGAGVGTVAVAHSFAEDLWDVFIDRVPVVSTVKKSVEGGRALSNLIYSADELSDGMLKMCAYAVIENEMKNILKEKENAFLRNQTFKNAESFIACANIYKALMVSSCDSATEYVESVENAERKNQVVTTAFVEGLKAAFDNDITWDELVDIFWSALGGLSVDGTYSDMKDSIAHIKQMTEEYNFYDICGDDVANYIRNVVSTTPSTWAEEYIDKAVVYNILPEEYQNNYQNNITRAEFCTLLTYLIESKSGESVDAIADRMGRPQITVQFDDTMYPYVDYIARIGIINGTGNNKFEPLGEITREQAAKMLCETAKALGYDTSAPQTNLSGVSDWAKEGTNFVVDRGIMTGTDNGFEPQGKYTKEQAITTMVRFFENLN